MTDRPILRLPEPRAASRRTGAQRNQPKPDKSSRKKQEKSFGDRFERLEAAFQGPTPSMTLRQSPTGIAPDRAVVFESKVPIANLSRAFKDTDFEVLGDEERAGGTAFLYSTLPTATALNELLKLWRDYIKSDPNESAPKGNAPWWNLFGYLSDLRVWGPQDRFTTQVRDLIRDDLPIDDAALARLELEMFPTKNDLTRKKWDQEVRARVAAEGGTIVDSVALTDGDFVYNAFLVELPAGTIRALLDAPDTGQSLAMLEGVQYIMPQTVAQAVPLSIEDAQADSTTLQTLSALTADLPYKAALLDGVPIAAHPALDGGVAIEDIHDLVRLSVVSGRHHATAMASLILRGDIAGDGTGVNDSHLLCVPVLIDSGTGSAGSPPNRLFLDIVHQALVALTEGDNPIGPNVFVVNFAIGIKNQRFANRMSSLSRLLDWWSAKTGILFIVSAGNVLDPLSVEHHNPRTFSDLEPAEREAVVRTAIRSEGANRTLLAPSEAMNALCVGAISEDAPGVAVGALPNVYQMGLHGGPAPQISSALGLGHNAMTKPDLVATGGIGEVRVETSGYGIRLRPSEAKRTGLLAAAPPQALSRGHGTSQATAMTTRAALQCAAALTSAGGPFDGIDLTRAQLSLLVRALLVNSAGWPPGAVALYEDFKAEGIPYGTAKKEVARMWGYGRIDPLRVVESPAQGATLVGLGRVSRNGAQIFDVPLPHSLSGVNSARALNVTVAWLSSVNPFRQMYRATKLEVEAGDGRRKDPQWGLSMKGSGPDLAMAGRGTVWSHRLVRKNKTCPQLGDNPVLPIRVQAPSTVPPDEDIEFALAVSFEVGVEAGVDVFQEVRTRVSSRIRASNS